MELLLPIWKSNFFLEFNDAYSEITGFSREELYTKQCSSFIIPEQLESYKTVLQTAITR